MRCTSKDLKVVDLDVEGDMSGAVDSEVCDDEFLEGCCGVGGRNEGVEVRGGGVEERGVPVFIGAGKDGLPRELRGNGEACGRLEVWVDCERGIYSWMFGLAGLGPMLPTLGRGA